MPRAGGRRCNQLVQRELRRAGVKDEYDVGVLTAPTEDCLRKTIGARGILYATYYEDRSREGSEPEFKLYLSDKHPDTQVREALKRLQERQDSARSAGAVDQTDSPRTADDQPR